MRADQPAPEAGRYHCLVDYTVTLRAGGEDYIEHPSPGGVVWSADGPRAADFGYGERTQDDPWRCFARSHRLLEGPVIRKPNDVFRLDPYSYQNLYEVSLKLHIVVLARDSDDLADAWHQTILEPVGLLPERVKGLSIESVHFSADDDIEAMFARGLEAVEGDSPDLTAAGFWFHLAAEAGSTTAMSNLGVIYAFKQSPPDLDAAIQWSERAAAEGEVSAMRTLGYLFQHLLDPPDFDQARVWLERASATADPATAIEVSRDRSNLARALAESGRPEDALALYRELSADLERLLGPEHLDTLTTRAHTAYWAAESEGSWAEFVDLRADAERVLGKDHELTLWVAEQLQWVVSSVVTHEIPVDTFNIGAIVVDTSLYSGSDDVVDPELVKGAAAGPHPNGPEIDVLFVQGLVDADRYLDSTIGLFIYRVTARIEASDGVHYHLERAEMFSEEHRATWGVTTDWVELHRQCPPAGMSSIVVMESRGQASGSSTRAHTSWTLTRRS